MKNHHQAPRFLVSPFRSPLRVHRGVTHPSDQPPIYQDRDDDIRATEPQKPPQTEGGFQGAS